jgi:hypothetical protein
VQQEREEGRREMTVRTNENNEKGLLEESGKETKVRLSKF